MVAAGHPRTAEVGATVLREGGNAVDAALAAVLASWVCEPLLTGPGAGGYLLVAGAGREPVVLDFFVAAPGAGADPGAHADLVPIEVDFGDARQVFNCGPASCGVPGSPAGLAEAAARWGSLPLADLCAPAARLAREGVALNAAQAFIFEILTPILRHTGEAQARFAPDGRPLREGERFADPELAETIERLGRDGAAPFLSGDLAAAASEVVRAGGGLLTREDLAAYAPVDRAPARAAYRGRQVLTNPPPSAGGILLALAFDRLEHRCPRASPAAGDVVAVIEEVQDLRTSAFLDGLPEPGFLERFLSSHLGSTTHIAAVDADGLACSVTCSNGACSGVMVPGTGIHLNNIMGETDLNPHGFFREPPGRRMPSMMAPTVVLGADGEVELALGSAGSNRIRSAILQVVVGALDHGLDAGAAIRAPRVHAEDGTVYAEPGVDLGALEAAGRAIVRFRTPNLFFGGAQAVERGPDGRLSGGGDPRRGGAAVAA
jgi:gamma-glutamyltranspeptidase/glutathione hydrolase